MDEYDQIEHVEKSLSGLKQAVVYDPVEAEEPIQTNTTGTCFLQTHLHSEPVAKGTNDSQLMMGRIRTEPSVSVPNGSSLRIEFMLNQNHGQIGALSLDECGNRIQN